MHFQQFLKPTVKPAADFDVPPTSYSTYFTVPVFFFNRRVFTVLRRKICVVSTDVHFKDRSLRGLRTVLYSGGGSDSIIDNVEVDEILKIVLFEILTPLM